MSDLPPLRLMGPARRHAFENLIWHFARGDDEWASNQLSFWVRTREWQSDTKVRRMKFVDRAIFWPFVPADELRALLPDDEQAKAVAALMGILPDP